MTAWRQSLDPRAWRRFTVRDGEKGPVAIEMVKCRVQTRMEHKRIGPAEWLVITRRPVTDERTLEARASRDATDHDARYRYQYYLTPSDGCGVAFQEPSVEELARVIKAGACIESSFKRGKGEVGMDEYQVRTWHGCPMCRRQIVMITVAGVVIGSITRGPSLQRALVRQRTTGDHQPFCGSGAFALHPRLHSACDHLDGHRTLLTISHRECPPGCWIERLAPRCHRLPWGCWAPTASVIRRWQSFQVAHRRGAGHPQHISLATFTQVVYLHAADNSIGPRIRYNPPVSPLSEGVGS